MGVTSDEVRRLVDAGEIKVAVVQDNIRLVTRAAANEYLKANGLPLVAAEGKA